MANDQIDNVQTRLHSQWHIGHGMLSSGHRYHNRDTSLRQASVSELLVDRWRYLRV